MISLSFYLETFAVPDYIRRKRSRLQGKLDLAKLSSQELSLETGRIITSNRRMSAFISFKVVNQRDKILVMKFHIIGPK